MSVSGHKLNKYINKHCCFSHVYQTTCPIYFLPFLNICLVFIKALHPYDEKENSTNKLESKSKRPLSTTSIPSPTAEAAMLFVLVNVCPSRTDMLRSDVMSSLILMLFIALLG